MYAYNMRRSARVIHCHYHEFTKDPFLAIERTCGVAWPHSRAFQSSTSSSSSSYSNASCQHGRCDAHVGRPTLHGGDEELQHLSALKQRPSAGCLAQPLDNWPLQHVQHQRTLHAWRVGGVFVDGQSSRAFAYG